MADTVTWPGPCSVCHAAWKGASPTVQVCSEVTRDWIRATWLHAPRCVLLGEDVLKRGLESKVSAEMQEAQLRRRGRRHPQPRGLCGPTLRLCKGRGGCLSTSFRGLSTLRPPQPSKQEYGMTQRDPLSEGEA